MPKAKPDQVIIHRIEFQDKEREMFETYLAVQGVGKVGVLAQGLGIPELTKDLSDPAKVIGTLYGIATVIEALGFETGLPTPVDFADWYIERDAKMEGVKAEREFSGAPDNVLKQIVDLFRGLLGMPYKPYDYNPFNDINQASVEDAVQGEQQPNTFPNGFPTPPGGWAQWAQDVENL